MSRHPDLDEQWQHVFQLSRDRKNGYGGGSEGIINFEEKGAHGGDSWPLTAESIRRKFGEPADRGDPESPYVINLRAKSHALLEQKIRDYLKPYFGPQYRAYNDVFGPDTAGDRDFEHLEKLATGSGPNAGRARTTLLFAKMAVDILTWELRDERLLVQYAEAQQAKNPDKDTEVDNQDLYLRYRELRNRGVRPKDAKEKVAAEWRVGRRRAEQIIAGQRLKAGEEPRERGRPRKEQEETA